MFRVQNTFHRVTPLLSAVILLVLSALAVPAFAQDSIPLVYNVENTGAAFQAPGFPDFAHLPIIRPLPDPFRFYDGTYDTSFSNWERRRNEVKAAIEKYEIGPKPDCHDCAIAATYTPAAAGSNAGTLQVIVTRNGKTVTLNSRVYIPQGMGNGPYPVLIPMSLAFPPFFVPPIPNYGSMPASVFSTRPIATIDFFHNDVTNYCFFAPCNFSGDPFYQMYPELCAGTSCSGTSNSGQYAAWAWGVSRLIDGIEIATHQSVNPLPIDLKRIAVTGCSYAGKMALFSGALDERIALTLPQESGGGGATAWRVSQEIEATRVVESLTRTDHNWFAGQLFEFSDNNVYKLPYDHHELLAMVAPRALLETGNTDFLWLSNKANYVAARGAQKVYNTLGIGDRFGFVIDGGHGHCQVPTSQNPAIAAFVDKYLLGDTSVTTDVQVHPYGSFDYARWIEWWGSNNPKFPRDWNPGNGTLVAFMNRPLDIGVGDNVLAGYGLYLDGAHPDATIDVAGATVQTDISCPDGSSYTLTVPLPDQSYSIPTLDNAWYPSPNQKSTSTYQGSVANISTAACSGGLAKSSYFSALGKQATSGAGNPAGPGFTSTDTTDPLNVRFHCTTDGATGAGGSWSPTTTVKY
ncbi:MAG TPA: hypothetical protein VN577_20515 [Terriglobales bacterium]|nr:hypothetical protein [Terriglobales bacterium]